MLAEPPVLLLDEPTRSLDPIAATRMRSTIKSLSQTNNSTIFDFPQPAEVEELCDRVAIISKGEIRALDTPQNLRAMHTAEERVAIRFTALSAVAADQVINQSAGSYSFVIRSRHAVRRIVVRFTRALNEELLDKDLRRAPGCRRRREIS